MGTLAGLSVERFAAEVASDSPAPGGGSCAAQAGSVGAALVAMVARLSVGRQDPAVPGAIAPDDELARVVAEADELRERLVALVDEDTAAFDAVMAALRLPKADDEQRQTRSAALRKATLGAADVPAETLRACLRAIELAASLAGRSNPAAASDLGAGVELARAGAEAAMLNVLINLQSVSGSDADERRAAAGEAIAAAREQADQTAGRIRLGLG
jgi:formiminotetrahydrofolate cyclodeaminase